jgi:hypothetical protein
LIQISVLRGAVTVGGEGAAAPVTVESKKTLLKKAENVELSALTKTELRETARNTVVTGGPVRELELKRLDEKSLAATLADLKTYDQAAYEKLLADQKAGAGAELSAETVAVATI